MSRCTTINILVCVGVVAGFSRLATGQNEKDVQPPAHKNTKIAVTKPALERTKSQNIEISAQQRGHSCRIDMTSYLFDPAIKLTLDYEQILIQPWLDKWRGKRRWVGPHITLDTLEQKRTGDRLELILRGNLHDHEELPFVIKVVADPSPYRVNVQTEILELPDGVEATGFCPCLQSPEFWEQNNPPFEAARKVFAFFEGRGFGWIADAKRTRAERHGELEEGPWIQKFAPTGFAGKNKSADTLNSPLIGWVADGNKYLIALAGGNAFQVGCRWFPCLHSNMKAQTINGKLLPFKTVIYVTPVDMDLLLNLYIEDFPQADRSTMYVDPDALWHLNNPGLLLGSFEGHDLKAWQVSFGSLRPYESHGTWISGAGAGPENIVSPEGVTEGNGCAVWEVPSGHMQAAISRPLKLCTSDGKLLTHLGVDAINRTKGENATLTIEVKVTVDNLVIAQRDYVINRSTNRRLLIALPKTIGPKGAKLSLSIPPRTVPVGLVLDNLRGFVR